MLLREFNLYCPNTFKPGLSFFDGLDLGTQCTKDSNYTKTDTTEEELPGFPISNQPTIGIGLIINVNQNTKVLVGSLWYFLVFFGFLI